SIGLVIQIHIASNSCSTQVCRCVDWFTRARGWLDVLSSRSRSYNVVDYLHSSGHEPLYPILAYAVKIGPPV
ncbi:UNVERIFIED_CONTAM: hypothetical protein Sindi_1296600, partial [Sesamum indicum]